MPGALQSKAAWAFGCILSAAALAFHYTAHYWYKTGLQVMHGTITLPYAIALIGTSLACGIALWHHIGSRFYSTSMLRRLGWCVGLGVAATIIIYSVLAVVLAVGALVHAASETGQGIFALVGAFVVIVLVGAWSVFVPAVPYGVAAGIAFYVIAESLTWMKKDGT